MYLLLTNPTLVIVTIYAHSYVSIYTGADPGFSERGSENLKKGIWSVAPEAIGIVLLNIKIIHLHEYM